MASWKVYNRFVSLTLIKSFFFQVINILSYSSTKYLHASVCVSVLPRYVYKNVPNPSLITTKQREGEGRKQITWTILWDANFELIFEQIAHDLYGIMRRLAFAFVSLALFILQWNLFCSDQRRRDDLVLYTGREYKTSITLYLIRTFHNPNCVYFVSRILLVSRKAFNRWFFF